MTWSTSNEYELQGDYSKIDLEKDNSIENSSGNFFESREDIEAYDQDILEKLFDAHQTSSWSWRVLIYEDPQWGSWKPGKYTNVYAHINKSDEWKYSFELYRNETDTYGWWKSNARNYNTATQQLTSDSNRWVNGTPEDISVDDFFSTTSKIDEVINIKETLEAMWSSWNVKTNEMKKKVARINSKFKK